MQFLLLIYEPESAYQGPAGETALTEVVAKHRALSEELRGQGIQTGGSGLAHTHQARTVVSQKGRQLVHDGPFAETREQLGGYYLIDVADMDAAVAVARRIPVTEGGKVEVRPQMAGG